MDPRIPRTGYAMLLTGKLMPFQGRDALLADLSGWVALLNQWLSAIVVNLL